MAAPILGGWVRWHYPWLRTAATGRGDRSRRILAVDADVRRWPVCAFGHRRLSRLANPTSAFRAR